MKNYKILIISLLLLVFMVGAVSAADENVTDDNLEISDEVSVDEEVVASSDVDEIEEEDILQQEDADLQDTLGDGMPVIPMIEFPDNPHRNPVKVFDGSSKEFYGQFVNILDQQPIADTNVNLVVLYGDEEEYAMIDVETDSEGYGRFTVDFPIGTGGKTYTINSLNPAGDPFHILDIWVYDSSTPSYIQIVKEGTVKDNYAAIEGEDLILNVYIFDGKDDLIPNSNVTYSVGNISDVIMADEGVYDLVINSLSVGQYNLSVYCPDINVNKTVGIYVFSEPLPTVIADNFTMIYGENKEFTVKLTDECGFPLINELCMIKIGSLQTSQRTDENGMAHFVFDTLDAGISYTVQITNYREHKSISRTITVLANSSISTPVDISFNCSSGSNQYAMSFTNIDGTPLANGAVEVSIDGVYNYTLTTDENGTVDFLLPSLAGGDHIMTITNPVTGEKITTTITYMKEASSISTAAVTTVYNGGKYVVFTLKDSNGVALSGKDVSVVLNGKTIKGVTDANGQFKVSTDGLAPKAYTATMTFAGDDYLVKSTATAKITVKKATPKMTAKKATFKAKKKTKKYSIVLKDNKNKAMKKVKVTLKVKGKTYKATTNAKGKATFKITKLTKKGKYTAKVKFAGNKNYNAVTKKVKITVKK